MPQEYVRRLRPEAGPTDWLQLNSSQKEAVRRLIHMISEAISWMDDNSASRLGETDHRSVDGRHRLSSHAFLSGPRGAGKTSVMASLASLCDSSLFAASTSTSLDLSPRTSQALERLRSTTVWLDPIDVDPVPRTFNFLAATLVRVEDAISRLGVTKGIAERGFDDPVAKAIASLKKLQKDACLAWNSNLPERRGNLDPQAFTEETIQTAAANVSINAKFNKTLDEVARTVFERHLNVAPIFVLPIDDTDMNPGAGLSLLKLLRSVSTPRIFTILMGDAKMLEVVASLEMADSLGLANVTTKEQLLPIDSRTVVSSIGSITATNLRKILPPQQRINLVPWTLVEALGFSPAVPNRSKSQTPVRTPVLAELLLAIPVQIDPAVTLPEPKNLLSPAGGTSLLRLLLQERIPILQDDHRSDSRYQQKKYHGRKLVKSLRLFLLEEAPEDRCRDLWTKIEKDRQTVIERPVYFAANVLTTEPRRLADQWFLFRRLADEIRRTASETRIPREEQENFRVNGPWQAALRHVWNFSFEHLVDQCLGYLREEPAFDPEQRRAIDTVLESTRAGHFDWSHIPLSPLFNIEQTRPTSFLHGSYRSVGFDEKTAAPTSKKKPRKSGFLGVQQGLQLEFAGCIAGKLSFCNRSPVEATEIGAKRRRELDTFVDRDVPTIRDTIDDDAAAHAVMLHDILQFSEFGDSFDPVFTHPLDNTETPLGLTRWRGGPSRTVEYAWPAPPAVSILGWDLFRDGWGRVLKASRREEQTLSTMAFAWLSLGLSVITCLPPVRLGKENSVGLPHYDDLSRDLWEELCTQYESVLEQYESELKLQRAYTDRVRTTREWMIRVVSFLMPEFGLPAELRDLFLFRGKSKKTRLLEFATSVGQANAICKKRAEFFAAIRLRRQRNLSTRLLYCDPRLVNRELHVDTSEMREAFKISYQNQGADWTYGGGYLTAACEQLKVEVPDTKLITTDEAGMELETEKVVFNSPTLGGELMPSVELIDEVGSRHYRQKWDSLS